jgi:hypothetical protein
MIKSRFCLLVLLAIVNLNCHTRGDRASISETNPAPLVILPTQSPTDGDSREPDLTTTPDGRVILSWVEKLNDKKYALRTATLNQDGWSEARTVSEGENWFINWADFPSVVGLKVGTLAAHWLV